MCDIGNKESASQILLFRIPELEEFHELLLD